MRPNKVKQLWREGKPAAIAWVGSADTYMAEVLANVGLDALVLDMQHGMGIGPDRAAQWFQAVSTTGTVPLARVPWNDPVWFQWVLDAGAYGIIVPLVNNGEEAAKAGMSCRYPPIGFRSIGPNRAPLYAGSDYLAHANEEIICLVMVENINTIPNLEDYEQLYPVRYLKHELRCDGGGPGYHRGGCGVEYHVEVQDPSTFHFRSEGLGRPSGHGAANGAEGAGGEMKVVAENGTIHHPRAYGSHAYGPCTYHAFSPGGGGWGDPLKRPVEAVARDVRDGLVSVEGAHRHYGVAIDDTGEIDHAATRALRTGGAVAA